MKCITLDYSEQDYLKNNLCNWLCQACLVEIFPFNHMESEDDFINECHCRLETGCKTSQLIYNPYDSNRYDFHACSDFDPDLNFYNEQNLYTGYLCKYVLEGQFNENLLSLNCPNSNVLSLIHANLRSIRTNLVEFENYLQLLHIEFRIIGVTDTWLNESSRWLYGMNNYEFIENHRTDKTGGGVGLFVRDNISFLKRPDLEIFNEYNESIFIEIEKTVFGMEKNVIIGVIYRPPNTDINTFNDQFATIMENIKQEEKICYLMGDYDINLLNVESHGPTSDFNDIMYSNGFIPLITRPTRVTESTATLIDNIFTNRLDSQFGGIMQGILLTDISDHYPIFHIDNNIKYKNVNIKISRRSYSNKNKNNFSDLITRTEWANIFTAMNTQEAFRLFHNKVKEIHDKCFPVQTISKTYNTRKPWLTDSLRDAIKKKNKLYYLSKKIKCLRNEINYKEYRNKLKKVLKAAEKKHHCDILIQNKTNSKKMWNVIKNVINRNKKTKLQSKFKLSDGTVTTDLKLVTEKFNDFFVNVGPTLARKIPEQDCNPEYFMQSRAVFSLYF